MFDYDPDKDFNRFNPEPHFRLYLGRDDRATVICVQDFDYRDSNGNTIGHFELTENK